MFHKDPFTVHTGTVKEPLSVSERCWLTQAMVPPCNITHLEWMSSSNLHLINVCLVVPCGSIVSLGSWPLLSDTPDSVSSFLLSSTAHSYSRNVIKYSIILQQYWLTNSEWNSRISDLLPSSTSQCYCCYFRQTFPLGKAPTSKTMGVCHW